MQLSLTPSQAQILSDTTRFRVLVCGRKFGKTTLASEELIACAFAGHGKRVMYVAPTLEDARRLMWDRVKNRFNNVTAKSNDTRLELVIPTQDHGTSIIFLGSWEKVDNYRGDEFDLIVFDEVQDYRNFWTGWQEAMRPTLTPRMGVALFMGTPKGYTHFYDLFNYEVKNKDFKSFHFTTYDNPHIPVQEIESARLNTTEDRFAQEYLADFRKTEGLVYKEFDRKKHLYEELPDTSMDKLAGIDFGYTNPAAVLHIYTDSEKFYVEDEWYKRGKTDAQIAEYVAACDFLAVYPDPESPAAIQELENAKVNVREVIKGKDSVKTGIQKVRELLLGKRLMVNKRCLNLIHELETYAYGEDDEDRNKEEKPVKANDHALDALRYVIMMRNPQETGFGHGTYQEANFDVY